MYQPVPQITEVIVAQERRLREERASEHESEGEDEGERGATLRPSSQLDRRQIESEREHDEADCGHRAVLIPAPGRQGDVGRRLRGPEDDQRGEAALTAGEKIGAHQCTITCRSAS